MMNNTLKSAMLTIAFLFVAAVTSFSTVDSLDMFGGIVVVEGDGLTAESDDVKDGIIEILMTNAGNGEIYSFRGCADYICTVDIASVPSGEYDVTVLSSLGGFDAFVYVD